MVTRRSASACSTTIARPRLAKAAGTVTRKSVAACLTTAGCLFVLVASPASAEQPSLPATAGPALLREAPPAAPQLQNSGVWSAPPILVSGAVAYREGELLYQDYLFDDHGAKGQSDGSTPNPNLLAAPTGTYTYPRSAYYHGNDADLVELRLKPLADATAFRVTLNTIVNPDRVAFTLALGTPSSPVRDYPFGANAHGPADVFVTVHGASALLTNAKGEATVKVDVLRKQITVLVPHTVWNPGGGIGTVAAGVGLWDQANNRYLLPSASSDQSHPGGGGGLSSPCAFFNVAFRLHESGPWMDSQQASALASNDMSQFTFPVSFGKLLARIADESLVPRTGVLQRVFASHHATGIGVDLFVNCDGWGSDCPGQYQTQLQPYALYVPPTPQPARGWGLMLMLHAHSTNHNEYSGTRTQKELANRGGGMLALTPLARGPDGGYRDAALADVFEAWADVARHYALSPAFTDIMGYSMGAGGVYRIAQAWPDLFAGAFVEVGADLQRARIASLRNVPVIQWQNVIDEFVPVSDPQSDADAAIAAGLRYELDQFPASEHISLALNDEVSPAAAFLATSSAPENPPHVTYVVDPTDRDVSRGMLADHAYWVSDASVRDRSAYGTVDARSEGFGRADPVPSGRQAGAGVLVGGLIPADPYTRQYQTLSAPAQTRAADTLKLKLTNVQTLTVHVARAKLSCGAKIEAQSDGPVTLTLTGPQCTRVLQLRATGGGAGAPSPVPPVPSPPAVGASSMISSGGCTVTATGGQHSCEFAASKFGSLGETGFVGQDAVWTVSHLVRRFVADANGCPIKRPDGTYETEVVRVFDGGGTGAGAVTGFLTSTPGVVYTVTLSGQGTVAAGTVDPTTLPGSAPSSQTPEDRTQGIDPGSVCGGWYGGG